MVTLIFYRLHLCFTFKQITNIMLCCHILMVGMRIAFKMRMGGGGFSAAKTLQD